MVRERTNLMPLFFVFALAVMVVMSNIPQVIKVTAPPKETIYSDLELTEHAQTAHERSEYNAESIARLFDNGWCKPQINHCADREAHWCSLGDGVRAIGLIISKTTQRIITGFHAKYSYWENMCGATA